MANPPWSGPGTATTRWTQPRAGAGRSSKATSYTARSSFTVVATTPGSWRSGWQSRKLQRSRNERIMAKEQPKLKLGKGTAFVKTHLKQLKQEDDAWEADFRVLPKAQGDSDTHYVGLVVSLNDGYL